MQIENIIDDLEKIISLSTKFKTDDHAARIVTLCTIDHFIFNGFLHSNTPVPPAVLGEALSNFNELKETASIFLESKGVTLK